MEHVLVVFNVKAGRKRAHAYIKLVYKSFKHAKIKTKFVYFNTVSSLNNIAKYDTIVVVGGDGTVNHVLPYLVHKNTKLGIIPAGTANLLSANLSIPSKASKAIKVILEGKTKPIDSAMVSNKFFILRLGFGYDAEICETAQEIKHKVGYLAYVINGIKNAFNLKRASYKIKLDDDKLFVNANSIIIANAGNMYKDVFTVAPDGTVDDGKLDIFIRRSGTILNFIASSLRIIFNRHKSSEKVFYKKASKIVIKTNQNKFHIDGEISKIEDDLIIKVIPKSINVIVP